MSLALSLPHTGGLDVYLPIGGTVIDVGANVGRTVRTHARAVGPTGKVIACEPNPVAMHHAQKNLRDVSWVEWRQVALDIEPGSRPLHVGKSSEQGSFWLENVPVGQKTGAMDVQTTTLDAICEPLPKVHGVKIDAQGAEVAILQGGLKTLARPETVWMIEVWPTGLKAAGTSLEALVNVLQGAGLSVIAEGKTPRERPLTWEHVLHPSPKQNHTNIICRH